VSIELGRAAFADAAWERAQAAFEAALSTEESADAHDGLGLALWWLGRTKEGIEHRERAYVLFFDAGRTREAAATALWISQEQAAVYGNHAVANGWFARAERLLADAEPCPERVSLLVRRAQRSDDFAAARAAYEAALALALECGARDLEVFTRSALGCLLVRRNDATAGFALLDDAMTAAVGGDVKDHELVALTSCNMLVACEHANDMARAREWLRVSTAWAKHRRCLPFFAFCRVTYGGVLMAQGRWSEAEDELVDSMRRFEDTHPASASKATVLLAELKIQQGELDDATELLRPWREHPLATCAVALLHLARGETELALSLLERRSVACSDAARLATMCALLVRAHLMRGEHAAAREASARLARIASEPPNALLVAMADAAKGDVAAATGDPEAASLLQRALDVYVENGVPFAAARARLSLARALAKTRKEAAVAEARVALASFQELAAAPWVQLAADVIDGVDGAPPAAMKRRAGVEALTCREREVLALLRAGSTNPEIAARLDISPKTAEHHVRAILAKLNVKTRAAAAAWAASQEKERP
jgi:ATP/maltotriose-dependent transcriptional regulator MalT